MTLNEQLEKTDLEKINEIVSLEWNVERTIGDKQISFRQKEFFTKIKPLPELLNKCWLYGIQEREESSTQWAMTGETELLSQEEFEYLLNKKYLNILLKKTLKLGKSKKQQKI